MVFLAIPADVAGRAEAYVESLEWEAASRVGSAPVAAISVAGAGVPDLDPRALERLLRRFLRHSRRAPAEVTLELPCADTGARHTPRAALDGLVAATRRAGGRPCLVFREAAGDGHRGAAGGGPPEEAGDGLRGEAGARQFSDALTFAIGYAVDQEVDVGADVTVSPRTGANRSAGAVRAIARAGATHVAVAEGDRAEGDRDAGDLHVGDPEPGGYDEQNQGTDPAGQHATAGEPHAALPGGVDIAEHWATVDRELTAFGFRRYHLFHWAQPGHERCYLTHIWRGGEWVGLGAGSHSRCGDRRWWNVVDPSTYMEQVASDGDPAEATEELTEFQQRLERAMFGLRLAEGVPRDAISPLDEGRLAGLIEAGLLRDDGSTVLATADGWTAADELAAEIVAGKAGS